MKKPSIIKLALILSLFTIFLFSCEEKCTCPEVEEHIGDYHLLYNYAGGLGTEDDPYIALMFSTKTGEVVDTIKTSFIISRMRYSNDGVYAVYRISKENNNNTLIAMNNLTGDTLATIPGNYGGDFFFSPDMQTIIIANSSFALLSFPSLDSIYVEEINTTSGGFMTDGITAFYMASGVDSLFFIDYSDPENIIKSSTPTKTYGMPLFPISAVVDYQNERLLLVTNYGQDQTILRIHDSNDFSMLNELTVLKKYLIPPVIRPGTDEVYLGSYIYHDPGNGYVDVYNFKTNVVTSLLKGEDITVDAAFDPLQLEFTPDGNKLYTLNGATIPIHTILEVNLQNGAIPQQFGPGMGYSMGGMIGINPIDFSK